MKKIVFFAPYPNEENIKEGMMQRVDAVDKMFLSTEYEKTYIIPRFKSFKTIIRKVDFNTVEIKLSVWRSSNMLLDLIKQADIVYCHSLYGMSLAGFFFLYFFDKKNFIWDVHGIIPEELRLAGYSKLKQFCYARLEFVMAHKAKKIIVVTNAMSDHLCKKYPFLSAKILIYPILPITIPNNIPFDDTEQQAINIIYAGNMQGYQNISLMVESVKKIINKPYLNFYILTGQKEQMQALFDQMGMQDFNNITIDSVSPSKLDEYYSIAHYGYVLRDNVDVNNVACPTKIVEYFAYGITCIVKTTNIGDFGSMDFDYINVEKLNSTVLKGVKSRKNFNMYTKISDCNNPQRLKLFVLED